MVDTGHVQSDVPQMNEEAVFIDTVPLLLRKVKGYF